MLFSNPTIGMVYASKETMPAQNDDYEGIQVLMSKNKHEETNRTICSHNSFPSNQLGCIEFVA